MRKTKNHFQKIFPTLILTAICGLGLFVFATEAQAATTYYVCNSGTTCNTGSSGWATGNDDNTLIQAQSKATPFKTIQKAADVVSAGDTVIVGNGIYNDVSTCSGYPCGIRIDRSGALGQWITFKAENKWGAVLDGNNDTGLFGIIISANYIRIEDFEIKEWYWDGIFSNESNIYAYMKRNKIHNNGNVVDITCRKDPYCSGHCGVSQGVNTSYYTYDGNVIYSNGRVPDPEYGLSNGHDHGLYIRGTNTTIINNIFYDHPVGYQVSLRHADAHYLLINNTFGTTTHYNTNYRGHIRLSDSVNDATINNNIFNSLSYAVVCSDSMAGNLIMKNNLTSSGVALLQPSCLSFTEILANNISGQNSLFIDAGNHNYNLQSSSPAINTGLSTNAPAYDILGTIRPQDTAYDIGAYEYKSGSTANPADINNSGSVNIKDIQACIKVITGADTTYENQCRILAAPDTMANIKDIQQIVKAIIGN